MSFPKYPEYKDSGIEWLGEVPAYWCIQPLKRQCDVMPSNVDKKSVEDERPVLLCNYTDVYYHDEIVQGMCFMKATASGSQVEKFSLLAGDVIFTKDSESSDDIAIAAHVPEALPGVVCGYHLSIARPHPSIIGRFLKHYFDSDSAKSYFNVSANGLTRVGLSQYASDNLPTPLPPVEEQDTIAAFLDHETARIDSLVEQQQRLIELLKEKRQAVISHAVTKGLDPDVPMKDSGVEWLGEVPAHWEIKRVKHAVRVFEQGWSPQCENIPVGSEREWGVLKVGCVNHGRFDCQENKKLPDDLLPKPDLAVEAGDILISRANTRELVGNCAVPTVDYPNLMLSDKLFRMRLYEKVADPMFLAFFMGASQTRRRIELEATGASSSMLNIGQSTVLEMPLPFPPLEEQVKIRDEIIKQTWKLLNMAGEALELEAKLKERRSALISAAVTGKIDVRGWKAEQHSEQPEVLMAAEERATYA